MRSRSFEEVRRIGVCLAVLLSATTATSAADDHAGDGVARWQVIVGLIQPGNPVGSGTGQVTGGGQPWSTLGGHANVQLETGHVEFRVDGLVLAGGNTIGTPLPITTVKGTLVCNATGAVNGGNSVLVDTPTVPLDAFGNARFEGDVGALPSICLTQPDIAFLVRIPAGRWIANGAVLRR